MASIVYFRRLEESSERVRYVYGYPEPDQAVDFDAETGEPVSDGNEQTYLYRKAVGAILKRRRAEGAWPSSGMSAS